MEGGGLAVTWAADARAIEPLIKRYGVYIDLSESTLIQWELANTTQQLTDKSTLFSFHISTTSSLKRSL